MPKRIPQHEVVLVGLNHCHLEVIYQYAKKETKPYRLSLIYSQNLYLFKENLAHAILKGTAGQEELIDIGHLCNASGVTLLIDKVKKINPEKKTLELELYSQKIFYDAISIETISESYFRKNNLKGYKGSILEQNKPQEFLSKLQKLENKVLNYQTDKTFSIAVIGRAQSTYEIAVALKERLTGLVGKIRNIKITLYCDQFHYKSKIAKILEKNLIDNDVRFHLTDIQRINAIENSLKVTYHEKSHQLINESEHDLIVLAGTGSLPGWLLDSELTSNQSSYIPTKKTFEIEGFAASYYVFDDLIDHYTYHFLPYLRRSRRKAFTISKNITTHFLGLKPQNFHRRPFRVSLFRLDQRKLLISIFGLCFTTKLFNKLKEHVDRKWIGKYHTPKRKIRLLTFIESGIVSDLRCFGGSSVLPKEVSKHLVLSNGINKSLKIDTGGGNKVNFAFTNLQSGEIDYFNFGRIALNNAVNSIIADYSKPTSIQFSVNVPYGPKKNMIYDFEKISHGIKMQAKQAEVEIISSLASCSSEASVSINAFGDNSFKKQVNTTENLDIIITKPLGTGIAIEAYRHCYLSTEQLNGMINELVIPHKGLLNDYIRQKTESMYEIAGYGVIGCLEDIMEYFNCGVKISVSNLPFYPGVLQSIKSGIRTNLHAQNKLKYTSMFMNMDSNLHPFAETIFDPQTSGALLILCKKDETINLLSSLEKEGLYNAAYIGETSHSEKKLRLAH